MTYFRISKNYKDSRNFESCNNLGRVFKIIIVHYLDELSSGGDIFWRFIFKKTKTSVNFWVLFLHCIIKWKCQLSDCLVGISFLFFDIVYHFSQSFLNKVDRNWIEFCGHWNDVLKVDQLIGSTIWWKILQMFLVPVVVQLLQEFLIFLFIIVRVHLVDQAYCRFSDLKKNQFQVFATQTLLCI